MLQICKLSSSVAESNHKNALIPIARYYVKLPRASQISRSIESSTKQARTQPFSTLKGGGVTWGRGSNWYAPPENFWKFRLFEGDSEAF
jgi:hypothetical protein